MDPFYTLSELAITLTGFAALFSILKSQNTKWDDLDKLNLVRFFVMIELGCLTAILCFAPIILTGYLNEDLAYRVSSFLAFVLLISYNIFALRRHKKISGRIDIGGLSTKIIRLIAILYIIMAILNSLSLVGVNYKSNYLILMVWMFITGLYFFIRLIYFSIHISKIER